MEEIKHIIIVGLGAIGSIYAVKLWQYDANCLSIVVDEERRARYLRDGIRFNGQRYDFNYVTPSEADKKADLVLIATKSQGLEEAISAVQPFVHDRTIIISLLNGISSPPAIAARYGWDSVLYAFFTGHGSTRRGNEVSFDGVGTIVYGEADNTVHSEKVQRVASLFARAGIDYDIPQDMLFAMWQKFVINVGINQASAVLRANYGVFQRNKRALEITKDLMLEAVAIASVTGINNVDRLLPGSLEFIKKMPPEFKSSMLQDVEAGRPTELDLFAGTVCELGKQYQVDTPYNQLFLKLIRALEPIQEA